MVMKDDGRMSNKDKKKQHKKYKDIKCKNCKNVINVDEKIELQDYDKIGINEEYVFYCDKCGESTDIIKL